MKASSCECCFVSLLGERTEGRWKETKHATNIHSPVTKTVIITDRRRRRKRTSPHPAFPSRAMPDTAEKTPSSLRSHHQSTMHGFLNDTCIAHKIVAGYARTYFEDNKKLKDLHPTATQCFTLHSMTASTVPNGFSPASLSNTHFLKPIPFQPPQRRS